MVFEPLRRSRCSATALLLPGHRAAAGTGLRHPPV